jgi:hypothetical protein
MACRYIKRMKEVPRGRGREGARGRKRKIISKKN